MRVGKKKLLLYCALSVICILLLTIGAGRFLQHEYSVYRKEEVSHLLEMYKENMTLAIQNRLNYAAELTVEDLDMQSYKAWFKKRAQKLIKQKEVEKILLFEGDKVHSVFAADGSKKEAGRDLQDFSYIYTLAKVVKEPVMEGPVSMDVNGKKKEVFLFFQPLLKGRSYEGEIAVILDKDYVIEHLNLQRLYDMGYEYHLWKVNSQDGSKEVVASSDKSLDYSYASKIEIYLPGQWTLSILPKGGWISKKIEACVMGASILIGVILSVLLISRLMMSAKIRYFKSLSIYDKKTGLFTREGFVREVGKWTEEGNCPFSMFYFSIEEYSRTALMAGLSKEKEYLNSIPGLLNEFIKSPYAAGVIAEGRFVVAVKEEMTESKRQDFAKGLSLKLIWKIRIQGKKLFLNVNYQAVSYPEDGENAEVLLEKLIEDCYLRLYGESPIEDLTEKCRRLAEGKTDVEFSEYADVQMMELSKALNQYRKRVEQVAYFDPVYNIGNRMKYLRDVDILIAYDMKRPFRAYIMDIRSFSKYNELFSVATGDALLFEMTQRLLHIFGKNLYRINGDVFIGISFEAGQEGKNDKAVNRIQDAFHRPIVVEGSVFTLDVLIGICDYPVHAKTSEKLLESLQLAVRYAKTMGSQMNKNVIIYNDELLEVRHKEAKILQLLETSIREETLEVWYQPLYHLQSRRFTGTEALVRLPDGEGGYVPAGEAIEIAEKNGLIGQVGEYVIRRACTFMKEEGRKLGLKSMGINLSVQQLLVENSVSAIMGQIKKTGLDPKCITLEITETVLMQSIEMAEGILKELSSYGVRIALDDFGIGYSSLNYLLNLPVNVLKFDSSMTRKIITSDKQYALLKAMIEMADINQMDVVVEGVETEQELNKLVSTSASYIQGIYYSKPLSQEKLTEFLREKNFIQ
ncbi:bifunctional diguanylate cyclase/phosphodiesterase [Anaerostipes sp.]|uniref:bifunctional diguanylate cyclase/phosphodiesterase n=1 Tax=Anaerostipes sp. TaxID=1872530 RepID=UPI0025C0E626|nr:bifunctional diguanylate cyclase/phosphodiesterase [Anaerostipes sp.]MBS7009759.1 GGDEF domain-containing protein [Anaerostipes sp.]